jgi:hypothetical protein
MEKLTFGAINTAIICGELDNELDLIARGIQTRREMLNAQLKNSLNVGDKVRFKDNTKPTYMRGMVATIISIKRERVVVKMEKPVGRFSGSLTTPVSLIEKA